MINKIFQLIRPKFIEVKYCEQEINEDTVLIRPECMSLCHADQRYYQGKRDPQKLKEKLPMALIHECCGRVVFDKSNTLKPGTKVVLIPNQPPKKSDGEFFENYIENSKFLSSGYDGFMQEIVSMPISRVVPYKNIDSEVASITEFISVAVHAINRFMISAHKRRDKIAIIGDGSLAYVVAAVLKYTLPKSKITILGKHYEKLQMFTFCDDTFVIDELDFNYSFDHAFECCGGIGSGYAINDLIKFIKPQGSIILMGVSEEYVSINTRDILEKGLTLIGSSRSGYEDFVKAIEFLNNKANQDKIKKILYSLGCVRDIDDLHKCFNADLTTSFKSVFYWRM